MQAGEKRIALFGSTGSVGRQTIEVVRRHRNEMKVVALAAKRQIDLVERQAKEFTPEVICIFEEGPARELRKRLPNIEILSGMDGLIALASWPGVNFAMMAMVGVDALVPTLRAIEEGIDIGVANKELFVAAGEILTKAAKAKNVKLFPVDSEHSAIFQCLQGEKIEDVDRLILTASGGPFLHHSKEELSQITAKDAANHPTWKMGLKVSIDCSTLMNKGFEVIEARWLFDIPTDRIDVIIHPQSLVHSFVEFIDGSMKAQISVPTMELPIQYALTYPHHKKRPTERFDFERHGRMDFYPPDFERFRCLNLAYEALKEGGVYPCYLNAANEVLVERFCRGELSWVSIGENLDALLQKYQADTKDELTIQTILEADAEARHEASLC